MNDNKAIFKVVGIFEAPNDIAETLEQHGYKREQDRLLEEQDPDGRSLHEKRQEFYTGYFYKEFREMLFLGEADKSVTTYQKIYGAHTDENAGNDTTLTFKKETKLLEVKLTRTEVFLFPDKQRTLLYSLQLEMEDASMEDISDLSFVSRNFQTEVAKKGEDPVKWSKMAYGLCLPGSEHAGGRDNAADAYSGFKFKVFTVIQTPGAMEKKRRLELLYDIGCGVPLGSAQGLGKDAPAREYYEEIMRDRISVFNNWDALPLIDSFTTIGNDILNAPGNIDTYADIYFRIYVFNLYFKFSLFRFSDDILEKSIRVRRRFDDFLGNYNISYISYKFLPNLIYKRQRKGLQIEEELAHFDTRVSRISLDLLEKTQLRSNVLLGIISVLAGLGSINKILSGAEVVRQWLSIGPVVFYTLVSIIVLSLLIPLLKFLIPNHFRILRHWWRRTR